MRALAPLLFAPLLFACTDDELGAVYSDVNEVHYQGGGRMDVLFVVDSSGSMSEEQDALAAGFDEFIESFLALGTDFHLGVTDMDYEATSGALHGDPRYLTPDTPNLADAFRQNVLVGTRGSGTEKGMEAARQALGPAKREGVNAGFYREEAVLVLVFVSDEDDLSTASNEEYLEYYSELKYGDDRYLSVNAIAGPVPGGCDTALAGTRYKDVVDATDGYFASICDEDLGMPSLGQITSGYKTRFVLQGRPEADSVVVAVDGETLEPGPDTWEVDDEGAVAFAPEAVPPDCSQVRIAYTTRDSVPGAGGDEALVFESDAPICARPGGDLLDVPERGGCAQTGADPSLLALVSLLGALALRRARR